MANYSLVINSKFRPFEYQELLAPVLMATQAHQAVEEAYADLSTKASIWDKMANEVTDPKAHALYKKYADDLQSYSDQLAQYGLTPTSRQAMLNMRSRYAKDIVPIETAYKRREADIAAQKEIMLKDQTHLFNRRASEVSLDEYLDNQNLDVLSDNYSRELLTQQVSQAAANLKQTLMKKGALTALGLPYQYERMIQYGASADDVLAAMSKDPKAMPILTKLVEDVMAASGIRNWSSMNGDWANNTTYQAAEAAAMRGLYSAIGTSKIDHFTDSFNMQDQLNARQHARAVAEQKRRERVAAEQARQQQLNRFAINPLNIYTSRDPGQVSKDYDKYKKYFYKDAQGHWKLTYEGAKRYRQDLIDYEANNWNGGEGISVNALNEMSGKKPYQGTFKDFVDNTLGAGNYMTIPKTGGDRRNYGIGDIKGHWQPGNIGNAWAKYIGESQPKYDAKKVTEFDYTIDDSEHDAWKGMIQTASRGLDLQEVNFNGSDNTFHRTGNTLSMADLNSKDYTVLSTRFSPYGNTVMIRDNEGLVRRYRMPSGINSTNEGNRDRAMQEALQWQQIVNSGVYRAADGTTKTATPDEITYAQEQYGQSIAEAYLYHSQLGVSNKTKSQEFNAYGY